MSNVAIKQVRFIKKVRQVDAESRRARERVDGE